MSSKEPKVVVTVRLDRSVLTRLRHASVKLDRTVSWCLNAGAQNLLDEVERPEARSDDFKKPRPRRVRKAQSASRIRRVAL